MTEAEEKEEEKKKEKKKEKESDNLRQRIGERHNIHFQFENEEEEVNEEFSTTLESVLKSNMILHRNAKTLRQFPFNLLSRKNATEKLRCIKMYQEAINKHLHEIFDPEGVVLKE